MIVEKLKKMADTHLITLITIFTVGLAINTYLVLGKQAETFIAIATIALVGATIYIAYFNNKLWLAQDRPYLDFRLKPDGNHKDQVNFYIKNIGKGSAIDITFKIENTTYSRKSLGYSEEILLETDGFVEATKKYVSGVKNIRCKDINGIEIKQDSIKFVDMGKIITADDRIQ